MTRMANPASRAASTMRLPSDRKTSGLGYLSSGMSLGRMNSFGITRSFYPEVKT